MDLGTTVIQYSLIFILNYIYKDCFQIRLHSEVPGRHEFEGDNVLPTTMLKTILYPLHIYYMVFALNRNHGFSLGISQICQRANEFIKEERNSRTRVEAELNPTHY